MTKLSVTFHKFDHTRQDNDNLASFKARWGHTVVYSVEGLRMSHMELYVEPSSVQQVMDDAKRFPTFEVYEMDEPETDPLSDDSLLYMEQGYDEFDFDEPSWNDDYVLGDY